MANFNKKWGTVIACWAVALVMIITGVCLGLTIPSSAAGDPVAVVTCGDTVEYFTDITKVGDYVSELTTSEENPATVKILKDIHIDKTIDLIPNSNRCFMVLDLAGHILQSDSWVRLGAALGTNVTIMDSNPTITRYVSRVDTAEGTDYTFYGANGAPMGVYADEIKGGVVISRQEIDFAVFYGGDKLTINGGNYFGKGYISAVGELGGASEDDLAEIEAMFGCIPSESIIINAGVFQVYDYNEETDSICGVAVYGSGNVEINGGSIYGNIIYAESDDDEVVVVNLANPQNVTDNIKVNTNIKLQETTDANGVKVYTAVDATTGEPIVPEEPDVPTVTEQPTNNNNSLVALIVLGAAAAVMVVGVTVIIIVNAKRRKKVA